MPQKFHLELVLKENRSVLTIKVMKFDIILYERRPAATYQVLRKTLSNLTAVFTDTVSQCAVCYQSV
jgi:hypothetical protein